MPISTFVLLHWAIVSIRIFRYPGWANWIYQPSKNDFLPARLPFVGPTFRSLIRIFYSRYRAPIITFMGRCFCFFILDYPRIEAVAKRIRYERFAHSFDLVPMLELSHPSARTMSRRLWDEPLYQFKSRWLVASSLGYALLCYPYLWRVLDKLMLETEPDQMDLLDVVDSMLGTAVAVEIVGRVGVELVWRWLRLDLKRRTRRKGRSWAIGLW